MDTFSVTFSEALCFGASFALSGLFYYLYKKSRSTVDKLENAPHFTIDEKLKDLLKVTPGRCLQYVVIEGAVKPLDEPLRSPFHREIVGVLQKFTLKEHRLLWSSISQMWMDEERIVHQRVNVVPFSLDGSNKVTVRVLSPLEAAGVYTEVVYEKFSQAVHGFGDLVGHYIRGIKPKGHLEIEEMLKVGTVLTGVGELRLDADETLSLRPPSDSSQYFLSISDFETLQRDNDNTAAWWKTLAVASALAGAAVLLWVGLRYYRQLKVHWDQEQEDGEAEFVTPLDGDIGHIENACVICLSHPRDCILLDCGHICCCFTCFQALSQPYCPICRQEIVRVLPVYQP